MKIGVPKEIKTLEFRVAITPSGADALVKKGHQVYIETQAGIGSGYTDSDYEKVGCVVLQTSTDVFETATLICKVKEPLEAEYPLIKKHHIVFTYFHLASNPKLIEAMVSSKATCIAYETVELPDRSLPLLTPMSEVAGKMAIQQGAKYLEKVNGGSGILLGGIPGVPSANVLVLGAGIVGTNAAKIAAGMGANVTLMDINIARLRHLEDILPKNIRTLYSNDYNISEQLRVTDLVVGAVLIPGAKAPVLVKREMLKLMKPGSVIIDVAVDQGGCIETCKPTTHDNPVYSISGVTHYCVANMPGAVPFTSTLGLTNATLPYIIQIAEKGWEIAAEQNNALMKGLNIVNGNIILDALK